MADKDDSEARKLFDEVATGTPAAPPPTAAAPVAGSPPAADDPRALFAELAKLNTPPAAAPAKPKGPPPTIPQQMASPIVRGASAVVNDLPKLVAAGALQLPAYLGPTEGVRKFTTDLGRFYLSQTGEDSPIMSKAAEYGLIPPDPSWRPDSWLGKALYDTTTLATEIGTGGILGRLLAPFKAAAPQAKTVQGALTTTTHAPGLGKRDLMVAPALGGVAGATASKVAPEAHKDTAESTAMALGSISPYIAVPKALRSALEGVGDFFRAPRPAATGQQLADLVGAPPRTLMDRHADAREALPPIEGWSPSPGAILHSGAQPGERNLGTPLLGIERRQADKPTAFRDPLDPLEAITPTELRDRNVDALQRELRTAMPEADPLLATGDVQPRIARARETAQRRAGALTAEADAVEQGAARSQQLVDAQLPQIAPGERTAARSDASRRMFNALEEAEAPAATHGGRLFEAVDPDKTARVPMYAIRDALDEVKRVAIERGRTDALPKVMRKPTDADGAPLGDKIDDYLHRWEQEAPNPQFLANVPYERVKGLRTRLTTAQREATDPQEREFLGTLISGVDNAVGRSADGALAEKYATARDFWRENVALPFRRGPVANLLKGDKEFTTGSSLMAPGERGGQNMQQVAAAARQDPDLYRSVVDYARADMTAFATNVDGRVNGAKLKDWVDKHAPVLQHFPELRNEFSRIASAQRTADTYFAQASERAPALRALAERGIKNTEDTIKNSAARFYLNAEPEDVVKRILAVPGARARRQAAEQAIGMLKTPEARDGLARAYYDFMVKRVLGGEERVMPKGGWKNSFTKMLESEANVAEVFLPTQVRERMKRLDRATAIENRRQTARANDGSRTSEDVGTADAADLSVGHRLVQALRGDLPTAIGGATAGALAGSALGPLGTGAGTIIGGAAGLVGRSAMIARTAAKEAALREAVFNPDVFERVMSSASLDPVVKKRIGDRILPYVLIANTEAAGDHARD
jgi:hypothetical protein